MQFLARCYGALNGHLPLQLGGLFKIKLLNEDEAFAEDLFRVAHTTIPENSGYLDPISKCAQV